MKRFLSILYLVLLWPVFSHLHAQNNKIDSLKRVVSAPLSPIERVQTLNNLAWEYRNIQSDTAEYYASQALELAEQHNHLDGIAKAYLRLAIANRNRGKLMSANFEAKQGLVYAIMAKDNQTISSAYNTLASIALEAEEYKKALYYFDLSSKTSQNAGDLSGAATSIMNMGSVYFEMRDYERSLNIYFLVLELFNKQKNYRAKAQVLNNIANIYQIRGMLDSAMAIYEQVLPILSRIETDKDEATVLQNIGALYKQKSDYKNALDNFFKALKQYEAINAVSHTATVLNNIADCYIEMDMTHSAERYIAESQVLSEAYKLPTSLLNSYELLYKLHNRKGDFKQALHYYTIYKQLFDSITSRQHKALMLKIETENELLLNSNDSISMVYERKIQDILKREREKNMIQYITILGMVLVVFLLIFYVVYFMVRKNAGSES